MIIGDAMSPWFSRLNPTPSFPLYSGPYDVGSTDFEIAASEVQQDDTSLKVPLVPTLAFRTFYPCTPPSKPAQPVYWVQNPQQSVLSGYARFLGANSAFSKFLAYFPRLLYWITLPVHRDAPLLHSSTEKKRWPVLVFSHGLGGSRNSYSHLCASLASYGIVVVAPEHRDGSGPISHVASTEETKSFTVEYRRIPHKLSQEVYDSRDEQLRIRLWELAEVYKILLQMDAGTKFHNLSVDARSPEKKQKIRQADIGSTFKDSLDLHVPGRVTWAGHSFGAATTVQFLKSIYYSANTTHTHLICSPPLPSLKSQITPTSPTILLDLWALPIKSPASASLRALPLPCFDTANPNPNQKGGASTLAVLSEAFVNWSSNLRDVKKTLADPLTAATATALPQANIFYPRKTAHLSQSDFGILFPRLTRYVAKADEPQRTLTLNVRAVLQVLRGGGISVAPTSAADLEGDGGEKAAEADGHDDWRILSRTPDTVRGWVAVDVDGDGDGEKKGAMDRGAGVLASPAAVDASMAAMSLEASRDDELRNADALAQAPNNRL